MCRNNGMISYILDGKATSSHSTAITPYGTGACHFIGARKKLAKFMRALADQQPSMRKGHTLIATLMSSGEFPLGLVYAHRIEEMKAKGMNTIEWVPLEPIVATPIVIGIGKNAPNPNAAKLFVDFFFSKEGQSISQKLQYRVPANPDPPGIA